MRFRVFALSLPMFIALASSFDLKCKADYGSFSHLGYISYCHVESLITTSPNAEITSVNGLTTPTTFGTIHIVNQTMYYIPKGLSTFFPNLRGLVVASSGLKSIQAADLENVTGLEDLNIYKNPITELSSDLLKNTTNLKYLYFTNNQITHVGRDLLTNLHSLSNVYFYGNKCINNATTSDIEAFKKELRVKCPHPEDVKQDCFIKYFQEDVKRYKTEISDLKADNERLRLEDLKKCEKEISDLKAENEMLRLEDLKKCEKEISDLKAENERLRLEDLKKCEKEISDLKAENEKLKQNCYNGLLDSSTRLLHEQTQKLKKCRKAKASEQIEDGPAIVLNVLNATDTQVSFGLTVASPGSKIVKILDPSGDVVQPTQTEIIIDQQNALFLPVNLGQLHPSARKLSVTFSGLYGLDGRTFFNMDQLTAINFTGNKIVEISEDHFSELTSLQELDLSHNNIEVISDNAFVNNAKLKIVKLNDNQLTTIDGQWFKNHKMLQKLFLNNNQLKYINAELLTSPTALKVADLSANVCIDMSHPNNTIKEIASVISDKCIAPVQIECKEETDHGRIDETHCEAEDFALVQPGARLVLGDHQGPIEKLSVVDQKMFFFPLKLSETLPDLSRLVVQRSQLTVLHKADFEGLSLLRELTIERNNLSLIEEGVFDSIPLITSLNLGYNNIESLPPKAFAKLTKVQTLILEGNNLKRFAASLLPKRNVIKDFQLQENQLETIDSKVLRFLRNADAIDLSGNVCINLKYQKSDAKGKTLMDLTGIIEFECADDSAED